MVIARLPVEAGDRPEAERAVGAQTGFVGPARLGADGRLERVEHVLTAEREGRQAGGGARLELADVLLGVDEHLLGRRHVPQRAGFGQEDIVGVEIADRQRGRVAERPRDRLHRHVLMGALEGRLEPAQDRDGRQDVPAVLDMALIFVDVDLATVLGDQRGLILVGAGIGRRRQVGGDGRTSGDRPTTPAARTSHRSRCRARRRSRTGSRRRLRG